LDVIDLHLKDSLINEIVANYETYLRSNNEDEKMLALYNLQVIGEVFNIKRNIVFKQKKRSIIRYVHNLIEVVSNEED